MRELTPNETIMHSDDVEQIMVGRSVKKILVVDDITYVVKSIARILQDAGYFVITAMTGKEAIEKFEGYQPDLITVDQKLPDMTGFSLVKQLRTMEGGENAKIIFISAVYESEEIKTILNLGIDHYLLKPLKKNKLLGTVNGLLK